MSNTVMSRIIADIQEGYTQDISLALLSEKYSISSSHLSALIKRELGLSFSEYITAKRMQKARELLKDEQLSIESIAEAVGYHDYFYFTKVFKKATGSPQANTGRTYRQRINYQNCKYIAYAFTSHVFIIKENSKYICREARHMQNRPNERSVFVSMLF